MKLLKKKKLYEAIYFLLAATTSLLLFPKPAILAITLIIFMIIGFIFIFSKKDIAVFCLAAIMGSFIEILCLALGVWQYKYTFIIDFPLWLPFAWGNAVLLINWVFYIVLNNMKTNLFTKE